MEIKSDIKNELFKRNEIEAEVEAEKNLTFDEARKMISEQTGKPEENIDAYNVKGSFGSKKFLLKAYVYDSKEDKDKAEQKTQKQRKAEAEGAKKAAEDAKKAAEAPAEEKASSEASAEEKASSEAPAEEKASSEAPAEEKASSEAPAEDKPEQVEEKPAEGPKESPAEDKPEEESKAVKEEVQAKEESKE